jgi:ferredoxin/flavodoxin---NADP+ reductase
MQAAAEAKFTEETVLWVKQHTPKLLTFAITRPEAYRFSAGQFSRLGFRDGAGFIWRAYSIVSAEYAETLEFFVVLIEEGSMSARLAQLQAGDHILLDKTAFGFLLPGRFTDGDQLVMLSTGSGIAPFLSMLQQPAVWERFQHIGLVHSVSQADELIFSRYINDLIHHPLIGEYTGKLSYQPVVTRESVTGALNQRLPQLLQNGTLATALGLTFTPAQTRFMLCGNPAMVADTFKALLDMGYSMHRNRTPGQIIMENGF